MISFDFWLSDDESDNENNATLVRLERRKLRDKSNPLEIPHDAFVKYFRVSKDLFRHLLNIVEGKLGVTSGSSSVLPITKLSAALRFFAKGGYQKGVGNDLFAGMAQPTLSNALSSIIAVLEREVCPTAIQFPMNEEEINAIKLAFYEKTGFPGVIGCVDGTHIRIISPSADLQHLYYNRKGFHSLNVMLVCDHKHMIRYVDANNPGSNHDSFIWNKSPLDAMLNERFQNGERNTWLLGDAGYPLKPYLVTPFRTSISTPSSQRQTKFNEMHSKTRMIVERTIGVLKNVFRCTLGARQLHYKPEKAARIVNVCCALHNLRLQFNVPIDEQNWLPIVNNEVIDATPSDAVNLSANDIRQQIMNSIA
ncbi:putative nuclease HARBI1 [Toxorhynchites rutilus septentrionalis]|uniref:putative nuclease HARBI1 n=1 Tax=Toxorhynchites rutilus septentrionalis TaxID=329112 RepID=UPI00247A748E|nr:putative nuclease HARBI1 [Toxorhynchites rutilus septentrionalis]